MLVYRLTRSRYAEDLSGEGARLFGGRWNNAGTPCLYTSEHRSLCLCEFLSNVAPDLIPDDLQFVTIEIDDQLIMHPEQTQFPSDWNAVPAHQSSLDFGTELLKNKGFIGFKMPSVIIPEEYNIMLNPESFEYKNAVKIVDIKRFAPDHRMVQ